MLQVSIIAAKILIDHLIVFDMGGEVQQYYDGEEHIDVKIVSSPWAQGKLSFPAPLQLARTL